MKQLIEAGFEMDKALASRGLDRCSIDQIDVHLCEDRKTIHCHVYLQGGDEYIVVVFDRSGPFDADRVRDELLPRLCTVH